VDAYDVITDRA